MQVRTETAVSAGVDLTSLVRMGQLAQGIAATPLTEEDDLTPELFAIDSAARQLAALIETFEGGICTIARGGLHACGHPRWQHMNGVCWGCDGSSEGQAN